MEHARPPSELCLDGSSVSRADAWQRWKKQFHLFMKASGVANEEQGVQAGLLLNLIGADGFDVYETFTFEDETKRDDVTELIKKFDSYFGVKPNITLARYNFFSRNQETGETIDHYVIALKLLSKHCQFKILEDELIRDRIVCGINNAVVRERLLRTEDLTLDQAVKICQVNEISADSNRLLESRVTSSSAGTSGVQVDAVLKRARTGRGGGGGERSASAAATMPAAERDRRVRGHGR